MLQEEDSRSAGRLPAVKNADHCLTWEVFPSPLQAMKPGNEGDAQLEWARPSGQPGERERGREGQAGARPREPSRGQLGLLPQRL